MFKVDTHGAGDAMPWTRDDYCRRQATISPRSDGEFTLRIRCVLGVLLLLPAGAASELSAGICRPPDAISQSIIDHLKRYSTATTGDNKTVRDSLHLPATSSVAVITSEGVCKKANRVYQAVLAGTGHGFSGQVYVIQIGTVHAVFDPVYHYGPLAGTFTVVVFDSRWRKLSMFNP